jgi:hypothetical protein
MINVTTLRGKFRAVFDELKQIESGWVDLCASLDSLPDNPFGNHLANLDEQVRGALKKIYHDLYHPTLVLATTGTTSSAKSSIVNLLCGAHIMPRSEKEMSAGIVTIHNAQPDKKCLIIHKTDKANWECNRWENIREDQIIQQINITMEKFHECRGINQPEGPNIELHYPIACFNNRALLNLDEIPETTRFQILDLPGLRNPEDKTNSEIIKKCKEALCLVAYNMQETDESKQRKLLEEVTEQVKQMGGSPNRMLFVLSRIDCFRKDGDVRDWQQDAKLQTQKILAEIQKTIRDRLPQYEREAENLRHCPLSPLPALYAHNLSHGDENIYERDAETLDKNFSYLIPKAVLNDLPRNVLKWEIMERKKVQSIVWKESYAEQFFYILNEHINQHFASLVLKPILQHFHDQVQNSIGKITRNCHAQLVHHKEEYDKECERLYQQNAALKTYFAQSFRRLHDPFIHILNSSRSSDSGENMDNERELRNAIDNLAENLKIKKNSLSPLYRWRQEISNWVCNILKMVENSLKCGDIDFGGAQISFLPYHLHLSLISNIRSLQKIGYNSEIAINGKEDVAVSNNEKNDIQALSNAVENFSTNLGLIIGDAFEERMKIEFQSIHLAMAGVLEKYLSDLSIDIEKMTPGWGLVINSQLLEKIDPVKISPPKLDIKVTTKVIGERNPWALWLVSRDVRYTNIPSASQMKDDWEYHIKLQTVALIPKFVQQITGYFEKVEENVNKAQLNTLDDFQQKMYEARQRCTIKKEGNEKVWKTILEKIDALNSSIIKLDRGEIS